MDGTEIASNRHYRSRIKLRHFIIFCLLNSVQNANNIPALVITYIISIPPKEDDTKAYVIMTSILSLDKFDILT